jgi:hypothetical protein
MAKVFWLWFLHVTKCLLNCLIVSRKHCKIILTLAYGRQMYDISSYVRPQNTFVYS